MSEPQTTELSDLVAKAAALHLVLEDARAKQAAAQAVIDATINDYVATTNRIRRITDDMIRAEADRQEALANG